MFRIFDAIKDGNMQLVSEIVNKSPNHLNEYLYGVTPLMYSLECGNEAICDELCKNERLDLSLRDNLDNGYLEKAIEARIYSVIDLVCRLTNRATLSQLYLVNETLLTYGIKNQDSKLVELLVSKGYADVNAPNKLGEYPLEIAIKLNKLQMVQILLANANLNVNTNKSGFNPLLFACENDLTEIACLLLDHDEINVNVVDDDTKWSPCMHSVNNNNDTVMASLLKKKCDLNQVDREGSAALHLAVESENDLLVDMLLKHGADKSVRNEEGDRAIEIAKRNQSDDIVQLLK